MWSSIVTQNWLKTERKRKKNRFRKSKVFVQQCIKLYNALKKLRHFVSLFRCIHVFHLHWRLRLHLLTHTLGHLQIVWFKCKVIQFNWSETCETTATQSQTHSFSSIRCVCIFLCTFCVYQRHSVFCFRFCVRVVIRLPVKFPENF